MFPMWFNLNVVYKGGAGCFWLLSKVASPERGAMIH